MNSFKKLFLFAGIKIAAFLFMLLPLGLSLRLGRCLGWMGYCFLSKKRKIVYANLKTVFALELSPSQLRTLTKDVFINFVQSVVEFLCLPKIRRLGIDKFVSIEGKECVDDALARGKGVIFLAIHSGSWEMANVVGKVTKAAYHVVVNDQSKLPQLDKMLNEYRTVAGAYVLIAGEDTKKIIKALRDNEIVSIVLDQGGKSGLEVPFLGKTSSMSTGSIRLALKYGCAVCPVWIERRGTGKNKLKFYPSMPLTVTGDLEKDVNVNVLKAVNHFERLLREHPAEYLWFYKVFKYSSKIQTIIVDDGRTGHLRQSQAVARHLREVLKRKGKVVGENIVTLQWRGSWTTYLFPLYVFLAQYGGFLKREDALKYFLTEASFNDIMKYKADFVISCGSQAAGVNYILSQNHLAKSVSILTSGLLSNERFNAVVLSAEDNPKTARSTRVINPKVSVNLINAAYLKEQSEGLIKHFSHLKGNVRTKFAVLIGGDTKGVKFNENQIRELIDQVKEAALHYNADILLTTSRRTPEAIEQIVSKEFKNFERCALCIIANQRNIPEAIGGILGLADLVIVSGESVSMVSEALSSGRSTIVFSPHGKYVDKPRDKYEDFVLKLNDQGYLLVTSVDNLKAKIAQLLSRKITLKPLDDQKVIQKGLEAIV